MSKTPRRMQMLQWCKAEKMIQEAVDEVEGMGADIRLTAAVIALSEARDHVADFVDGAPFRPTNTRVSDSQGEGGIDLKAPLSAREEELQKLYLACQDNRREERLLHDRALSTLREENERLKERWGKACGVCGSRKVKIRGKYPSEPDREVCSACVIERLEDILTFDLIAGSAEKEGEG